MSGSTSSFHSKIYNDFQAIDMYAHQAIVKFYVDHEEDIQRLKFHEFFELQLAYIDALYEVTLYENMLTACEETIVAVIENNIQYHHGEDIYRKLLLKKASAHYNLLDYHQAEFVLKELIKMDPTDAHAIHFLKKCQIHRPPKYVQHARGTSLILFLFTAMVICFEMSYFGFGNEPNGMEMIIEISRNIVFLAGWLTLVIGDGIFRYKVSKKTNAFVDKIKLEKVGTVDVPTFSKK